MGNTQDVDADIVAIRALLADEVVPKNTPKEFNRLKTLPKQSRAETARRDVEKPAAVKAAMPRTAKKPVLRPILFWLLRRVGAYRPNTKSVLWTSLILMLLLQPVLVFGTLLLAAVLFLSGYLIMGSDRFWRRLLEAFAVFARWCPGPARRFRVGCRIAARKWDACLNRLPGRWTDGFRAPDLRQIARADKLHAKVMADRLSRLRDEGTT
ncbi:hypothetical protein [uncultured Roseobacter sp.]|uniref:hypothetical protein n=1 Tax=uncultured Roseobacter sp. TaxID=114847 RepID=UPI002611D35E|nr:hypothetical protein [uncultured Roseobacter sp.]